MAAERNYSVLAVGVLVLSGIAALGYYDTYLHKPVSTPSPPSNSPALLALSRSNPTPITVNGVEISPLSPPGYDCVAISPATGILNTYDADAAILKMRGLPVSVWLRYRKELLNRNGQVLVPPTLSTTAVRNVKVGNLDCLARVAAVK